VLTGALGARTGFEELGLTEKAMEGMSAPNQDLVVNLQALVNKHEELRKARLVDEERQLRQKQKESLDEAADAEDAKKDPDAEQEVALGQAQAEQANWAMVLQRLEHRKKSLEGQNKAKQKKAATRAAQEEAEEKAQLLAQIEQEAQDLAKEIARTEAQERKAREKVAAAQKKRDAKREEQDERWRLARQILNAKDDRMQSFEDVSAQLKASESGVKLWQIRQLQVG
jgi:hypothetical protein